MHTAYEFVFSHITFILYIMLFLFLGSAAIEIYQYNNFNHTVGEVVSRYGGLTEPAAKNIRQEEQLRYGNLFTVKTAKRVGDKFKPDKDFTDEPVKYGHRINYFIKPRVPFMNTDFGIPVLQHVQSDVRAEDVENHGTKPKYPVSDIKILPVVTHARISYRPANGSKDFKADNKLFENSFDDFNNLLTSRILIKVDGKYKALTDANPGAKAELLPTTANQTLLSNGNYFGSIPEKQLKKNGDDAPTVKVRITWSNNVTTDVDAHVAIYGGKAALRPSMMRIIRHDDLDSNDSIKAARYAISNQNVLTNSFGVDYSWASATSDGEAYSHHEGTVKITYRDGTYQLVDKAPYELSNKEIG